MWKSHGCRSCLRAPAATAHGDAELLVELAVNEHPKTAASRGVAEVQGWRLDHTIGSG